MTVSDQIIQVLNALCAKFGVVIDWTSENVIPYISTLCTKLISWEIWTSVAWMAIMTLVGVIAIVFLRTNSSFVKSVMEEEIINAFFVTGCIVLFVAVIGVIGTQIFDIIKCFTFPEMYVFEYVQGLINSGG